MLTESNKIERESPFLRFFFKGRFRNEMDLTPFCLQLLDDPNINIEELVSVSVFASLPSVDGLEPDYRVTVTSPYRPLISSVTGSRTSINSRIRALSLVCSCGEFRHYLFGCLLGLIKWIHSEWIYIPFDIVVILKGIQQVLFLIRSSSEMMGCSLSSCRCGCPDRTKSIVVSHCHKVYTISAWCRSFAVCEILRWRSLFNFQW